MYRTSSGEIRYKSEFLSAVMSDRIRITLRDLEEKSFIMEIDFGDYEDSEKITNKDSISYPKELAFHWDGEATILERFEGQIYAISCVSAYVYHLSTENANKSWKMLEKVLGCEETEGR